ncbi:PRC-barrel domain-containing protein [Nonomuraea sp. NPDC002799]
MTIDNIWQYRPDLGMTESVELVGYEVEAPDGKVGKVDQDNNEVGDRYLVVDTGPWIFGKKVLLPASTVTDIDHDSAKIYVARTKEEIKNAPPFHEDRHADKRDRDEVGGYYARFPGTG